MQNDVFYKLICHILQGMKNIRSYHYTYYKKTTIKLYINGNGKENRRPLPAVRPSSATGGCPTARLPAFCRTAAYCLTASPRRRARRSRPCWSLAETGLSTCSPSSPNARIAAATSAWEAGRSTAPTTAASRSLATSRYGGTSVGIRSRWRKWRKSARKASRHRNLKCTGTTGRYTASGSAFRPTGFKL